MQGEKDWEKYEVARKLKSRVDDIRYQYLQDLKSKQMVTRQRAVALYFIDKVWVAQLILQIVTCSHSRTRKKLSHVSFSDICPHGLCRSFARDVCMNVEKN